MIIRAWYAFWLALLYGLRCSTACDCDVRSTACNDASPPRISPGFSSCRLFIPRYSILLGAAYIRHQMDRVEDDEADLPGDDPVLNAVAAYNAGRRTTTGIS